MTLTQVQPDGPMPTTAYPAGTIDRYSEKALEYLTRSNACATQSEKSQIESAAYLLAFWKQCDDDDVAAGKRIGAGGHGNAGSFWLAYEEGRDIHPLWLETGRRTIEELRQAAEAEAKLLETSTRTPRTSLPLMAAQKAGISKSALLGYARLSEKGQALAHAAVEANGTLKWDFVKQIIRICNQYPEMYDKVLEGIRNRQYKVPEDIRVLLVKYEQHKAAVAAAEAERKCQEAEAAAQTAAEAQAEADRKLAEELESALPDEPTPAEPAEEGKIQTTYPVQDLIDGIAFEGLQNRYERDKADFFTDMRELYAAARKVKEISERWGERLQDQHLSGHKAEMLLWETYSVAWERLGKFKKLGGSKVTSVPAFWQMIGEIAQSIKQATALCVTYTTFSTVKYGPFKVAETKDEHYQPGRVA